MSKKLSKTFESYIFGPPKKSAAFNSFQTSLGLLVAHPARTHRESKLDGVKYGPGSMIQGIDTIVSKNISNKCSARNKDIF